MTNRAPHSIFFSSLSSCGTTSFSNFLKFVATAPAKKNRVVYEVQPGNNLSVIAALALDQYAGFRGADPVFGILIALIGAAVITSHLKSKA